MGKLSRVVSRADAVLLYDTLIAEHLRREATRKAVLRYRELHASMLDDPFCPRCALEAITHPPEVHGFSTKKLLIFMDGVSRHEKWQRLFEKAGIAHAIERPFVLGGFICTPDAIIELGGERYVWECKSMSNSRWKSVMRNGPPDAFVNRLHVYFAATGIQKGILHVENKDTNEYAAWEIRADPDRVKGMLERAKVLGRAYREWKKTGKLPDCVCLKKQDSAS
jgi:hypothetical protein